MTVPTYHTPLSITVLGVRSSGKAFHSSDVSLSTYFYPLKTGMQKPIYPNLFAGRKTPANVSNIFGCFPANTSCVWAQVCDVFQTSLLPENFPVNSSHPGKSKEYDTLDYQYVTAQTFGQINNKPTDNHPITINNDQIHSPVDVTKPSKFGSPYSKVQSFSRTVRHFSLC